MPASPGLRCVSLRYAERRPGDAWPDEESGVTRGMLGSRCVAQRFGRCGQLTPPILVGNEEDQREQARQLPYIRVKIGAPTSTSADCTWCACAQSTSSPRFKADCSADVPLAGVLLDARLAGRR